MRCDYDLAVFGAGAAGLAAALAAAKAGARVVLIDRADVAGRKVRLAGGGKGNVTNRRMGPEWFVGKDADFCAPILDQWDTQTALAFLADLRVPLEEREDGQLFSLQAAGDLVEAMLARCRAAGVTVLLGHAIERVTDDGPGFALALRACATDRPVGVRVRRLLIALGSPAWPQVGASDDGARLAGQWGHATEPFRPVLVPFVMPESWPLHGLAGVSLPVTIRLAGRAVNQAALFTHKGLSGPAVLTASCFWQAGVPLVIDFLPHTPLRERMHAPENGKQLVSGLLARHLPARLAQRLVATLPEPLARRKVAEVGRKDRERVCAAVHAHEVTPTRTEGMARAEAAAGGVRTEHANPYTLESRLRPGLYFAGEVLDVTGLLGGYNLHWAWASGSTAGQAAALAVRSEA